MDIFEKCRRFYTDASYARSMGFPTNPRTAQALGMYPYFIPLDASEGAEVLVDGRKYIMLGSNNYLALTHHPDVQEAASRAVRMYGSGCTGSRFMNGTLQLHLDMERELASFLGKEAALVFTTGYQANTGVLSALLQKGDVVIADKEAHASILDGIGFSRANGSVEVRFFRHNDVQSLCHIMEEYDDSRSVLVIVDGVYSMSGDLAPLREITAACVEHHVRIIVDDAHGIGVLGDGRGSCRQLACEDDVDLIVGTFSKSFASIGGFVAGRRDVIQWIQHQARSFIFTASLPPASLAAAHAALKIIRQEPWRRERVIDVANRMRDGLKERGFRTGSAATPIVPVYIGDSVQALRAWNFLMEHGVYTNVALPPAVPSKSALLRTSYCPAHTDEHVETVLGVFSGLRDFLRVPEPGIPMGVDHGAH